MTERHAVLNRFGLGARPDEVGRPGDGRGWLLDQLGAPPPPLHGSAPSDAEVETVVAAFREAVGRGDQEAAQRAGREAGQLAGRESAAVLATRAVTDRPFAERWVAFWSNHLCISIAAGPRVLPLAGHYERTAIRPNAFGRFEDLLLASARHPAMLSYLDNAQSVGPDSMVGRRTGRGGRPARGLNENYARELLELHTVGVDGGYGQSDVEALARILTGWTVTGFGGPFDLASDGIGFRFVAAMHQPGAQTVLGRRYAEDGEAAGRAVIRDLARRPETARFLSTKIVRHFVADDPPAALVDLLVSRWMETEGDLREVATTLVRADGTWDPDHRKFRTPHDWLIAILRATGIGDVSEPFVGILRQLRQPVWGPPAPTGWSDLTRDWADPDALMNRAELARTVSTRIARASRGRFRPLEVARTVPLGSDDPLPGILGDDDIPLDERIALAFAGPAFQWR